MVLKAELGTKTERAAWGMTEVRCDICNRLLAESVPFQVGFWAFCAPCFVKLVPAKKLRELKANPILLQRLGATETTPIIKRPGW